MNVKLLKDKINYKLIWQKYFYLIIGLAFILIFIYLAREVTETETYKLDLNINAFIKNSRTPYVSEFMKIVSDIGLMGGMFIIGFISAYLFFHRKIRILIGLLCSTLSASLLVYFLKLLIARDRPELISRLVVESGFSFPSGHATTAFTAFPILAVIVYNSTKLPKILKYLFVLDLVIFPFLVAFSRLYLGVHYFTDVVAGGIIGLTATCAFYYFNSHYYND